METFEQKTTLGNHAGSADRREISMIERVARAIAQENIKSSGLARWQHDENLARAAIAAMREPTTSKIEITASDAAGRLFVGVGEVRWIAATVTDGASFKPAVILEWRVMEPDGTTIGWLPLPVKREDAMEDAQ